MDSSDVLAVISGDQDAHIALLQRFIQAKSPNPPGATADAAQVITDFLQSQGVPFNLVSPQGDHAPNIVSDFAGGLGDGPRVAMNGHLDVFPVDPASEERWSHGGAWSGHSDGTYIFGRGGVDMKAGTAATAIAYVYLYRHREHLSGSVALSLVSDEETGGKYGTRWLLENEHDREGGRWRGDVMVNAEPGGLQSIRFGEKGTLRLTFRIQCKGMHGAYTHLSEGANRIGARFVQRLLTVEDLEPELDESVVKHVQRQDVRETIDEIMGKGAAESILRPTVNIGVWRGGVKVNMIPDFAEVQADIRLPIGLTKEPVLAYIQSIIDQDFNGTVTMQVQEAASNPPNHCAIDHPMVKALSTAAEQITGRRPLAIPGLGATDAKFWRYHNTPAYVFGVSPETMASERDERVKIDEFLVVLKTHALAVWEYLKESSSRV